MRSVSIEGVVSLQKSGNPIVGSGNNASVPTLATFGAGSDGTTECTERRRERVGRKSSHAQLNQALQQPARPTVSVVQVVDTRVLG